MFYYMGIFLFLPSHTVLLSGFLHDAYLKCTFLSCKYSPQLLILEQVELSITTSSTWLWIKTSGVDILNPCTPTFLSSLCLFSIFFPWLVVSSWFLHVLSLSHMAKTRKCSFTTWLILKGASCRCYTQKVILLDLNGTRIIDSILVHYFCSSHECFEIRNLSCSVSNL